MPHAASNSCPECFYDLSGLRRADRVCPECGLAIDDDTLQRLRRRDRGRFWVSLGVALVAPFATVLGSAALTAAGLPPVTFFILVATGGLASAAAFYVCIRLMTDKRPLLVFDVRHALTAVLEAALTMCLSALLCLGLVLLLGAWY